MELSKITPLVMYDDRCYLCTKFAQAVNFLTRGRLSMVGHYTETGEKIRQDVLDSDALEMFWLLTSDTAFGGRAALIPLFQAILYRKSSHQKMSITKSDGTKCKTAKAVFVRSASLITNSKKIPLS